MTRIERLIPALLGVVFLAAGLLKVYDPAAFALSIARLRILPMALVGPAAILLPWVEIVAAVAAFLPRTREAAVKLLLGMLVLFTAVLAIAFAAGTAASCGCFGKADFILNRPELTLVRNVTMIAVALLWLRAKPTSPAAPASPASDTGR